MFKGIYYHQIDEKGRLRIPAKLKAQLGDKYFITRGGLGSLVIASEEYFEENIFSKIKDIDYTDVEAMKLIRAITSFMFDIEEDNQGRFVLPPVLREYANIVKNVVTIGAGNVIEVWSEERFNQSINGNLDYIKELPEGSRDFNEILRTFNSLLKRKPTDL
ncbi:MAG TPA: transcriptional regulator MraZ [Clostridia bacterium]|jgi:MraZ protein